MGENKVTIAMKVNQQAVDKVDRLAEEAKVTRSEMLRQLLSAGMSTKYCQTHSSYEVSPCGN